MKSSKVKKIVSIVIISLVLAITIVTVVLALVPNKLYNPIVSDYDYVTVYKKDESDIRVYYPDDSDKTVINNIATYLKKSVQDNILSSMFQGTSKFENKIVVEVTNSVLSNVASGSNCLVFGYVEEQTLMWNGKEYRNPNATGSNKDKVIKFNKLVMPLSNDQDFQEREVYVIDSGSNSNYKIKFLAHQSELYNYIESLEF